MTSDEQFETLLRLYNYSVEHNIVLRGKLALSQALKKEPIKMEPIKTKPDETLGRIYSALFGGEFMDQEGFLIAPAADRNLLRAIETVRAPEVGLSSAEKNKLLAELGRGHDQLQDVRNILKGKGHE